MKKRMIKIFVLIFIVSLSFVAQGKYIRKQIQPNFFMPNSVNFNKQEKLPPVIVKKQIIEEKKADNNESIVVNKLINNTPEYKQKFDQYSKDILYLNKYKKLPKNNLVVNDLRVMNSDILMDFDINESINSSEEFDKIIDNLLSDV